MYTGVYVVLYVYTCMFVSVYVHTGKYLFGTISKVSLVAILTSIINLTPKICFCACSVSVYNQDLADQLGKHMSYCTQKTAKS